MGMIRKICRKIDGYDDLLKKNDILQNEIDDRDTILKRIKIVATSNHYGYTEEDKKYREDNCINIKLRKIFELACEFDEKEAN